MTSPHEKREADKARLAAEFAELDPEQAKQSIIASFIGADVETAKRQVIASWREVAADFEHAAIVADFMSDPESERLVMNSQLLDWCAENEAALVAASQKVETWFRAFDKAERNQVRRSLLSPEEGEAIIAASEDRLRRVRHLIANHDTDCMCLVCGPAKGGGPASSGGRS